MIEEVIARALCDLPDDCAPEGIPEKRGWYAVTLLYDYEEGELPSPAFWTGTAWRYEEDGWQEPPVIRFMPGTYDSEEAAGEVAYGSDIDSEPMPIIFRT